VIDKDIMNDAPATFPEARGNRFSLLIPVFFVTSGLTFDLAFLVESVFGDRANPFLPRGSACNPGSARPVLQVLQATSLPFIVAAAQIGMELVAISEATAAALVAANPLPVMIFPLVALTVLRGDGTHEESVSRPGWWSRRRRET
jgi:hypothetical protein